MDASDFLPLKAAVEVNHALDSESKTGYITAVCSVSVVLTTVAVLARIYTRVFVLHTFGRDDFVMAVAQVFTLLTAAAILLETAYGLGRHIWLLENSARYGQAFFSSIIVYNVGTCILKISILFQYRRIFRVPLMQTATLVGLIFEGAWALTLSVLLPLVCTPVAFFWDSSLQGTCLNQLAIWYVMAAINLVTDFVIFSLPLPVIKSLQLPKRQKALLMGVFCLGFCTCIISVYRITTLRAAAAAEDSTWDNVDAAVWSLIELVIGVLAACLPTLKPLFAMIMPRFFRSSLGSRTNQYKQYGMSTSKGAKSIKTGHSFPFHSNGGAYVKELDDDMDALRAEDSFTSSGSASPGRDIEMQRPSYNVSVTGGGGRANAGAPHIGGIQTTTVVTQRVDSL
ncbi:hypothetical protein N0V93_007013 [Gnomoniopsis smithogilvyi]|uniref:Rhodopsin domain-containing protein n=1 Tax=Gnomoniopsis smithogilvyi TaxID=1191159 RepID=A0A9W8YPA4_9PEZI|nr:hypothetical protein N0V93_007013 [Gnomoniopsis smithogilvyi]